MTTIISKNIIFFLLTVFLFSFCNKKDQPELPDNVKIVNDFIYDNTTKAYLWNNFIPAGIDVNNYFDSYKLFDAMYYPTLDHWSFVTDDYLTVLNSLNGSRKTAGYRIQLYIYPQGTNVFAWVEYVYEGGPAALAGIKRGDIIISVNGQILNTSNYQTLLTLDAMDLGFGDIVNNTIVDNGLSASIAKVEMTIDPILQYSVQDIGGKKIGYLLYDQFTENVSGLEAVMGYFVSQNINDLVLDLRYNSGGYVSTCTSLASMLAPSYTAGEVFLTYQWNDNLTAEIMKDYGAESEYIVAKFPTPSVNLNLSRMFVLTSRLTASASESLVNCLRPYMDITLIGDTTSGKYTGAGFFCDTITYAHTWGLYLVMNRIANANGVTDFVDGFTPNYLIYDDLTTPLGDATEPLFAKAIGLITGAVTKSVSSPNKSFESVTKIYENRLEKDGMMVLPNRAILKR